MRRPRRSRARRTGSRVTTATVTATPTHCVQRRLLDEDVDADEGGGDRERELAERGEERRRALQAVVVEIEREVPGDDREERDVEAVVRARERLVADDRQRGGARDQAEGEAHGRHLLELEPPGEIAAEHGAHAPERGGAERLDDRRQPVRVRIERMRQRDQPDAGERRQQEPREPRPRLLAENEPRAHDGDERLRLLQDEHRDEVAVEERLREEDRRDRRRARADGDAGGDVARPCAQSARKATTSSGRVRATSTTCSPKTIVAGLVECESGLRISPSSPHIAAAMLTSTTPGMLLRRCISIERTGVVAE